MLTKKDFTDFGYEVDQPDENIFIIKDFVKPEELEEILREIESKPEEAWLTFHLENIRNYAEQKYGTRDIEQLSDAGVELVVKDDSWSDKVSILDNLELAEIINSRIEEIFSRHANLRPLPMRKIQRQYEGAELQPHDDSKLDPANAYAIVAYLNDDYTGGELHFPGRGLKVIPKAGSVVVFPATSDYIHGVKPPGPGPTRYVMPAFISTADGTNA